MHGGTWKLALVLVAGVAWGANSAAQDADKAAADALKEMKDVAQEAKDAIRKIASSGEDFKGDRLTLRTTMRNFVRMDDTAKVAKIAVAGTKLRVLDEKNGDLTVEVESIPCATPKDVNKDAANRFFAFGAAGEVDCAEFKVKDLVTPGEAYLVQKSAVLDHGYRRSGWVYGALLVPYKYHRHDKSFSSAATIGPYLGYRLDGLGFDSALVGSIGIASLSVQNNNGGTTTLQGYTAAIGIIASVSKNKNPLQIGLLLGRDWAGSNSAVPYAHEGKTWLAVQIGFSFSE